MLFLAVASPGETPVDGGWSVARGRWASALQARLGKGGIYCGLAESEEGIAQAMLEKLIYTSSFALVGSLVRREQMRAAETEGEDLVDSLAKGPAAVAQGAVEGDFFRPVVEEDEGVAPPSMGEVIKHHEAQLRVVVDELLEAGQEALGFELEPGVPERVLAYGALTASLPAAIVENSWQWTNGWFHRQVPLSL